MSNIELANFIAEFIMSSKDTVIEAIEKDDITIVRDEAYEYIKNCE